VLDQCPRPRFVFVVALGLAALAPDVGWAQSNAQAGTVEAGADGFRLVSADEAFELRLRGDLYADLRTLPGSEAPSGAERFFLRRARPRFQGTLYERFGFGLRPDFGIGGPEIDDAYLEARFAPSVRLRMGRFKVPVGLENLQSTTGLMHVERGFPTALVPGRDVGAMLGGDVLRERLQYAVGLFNGAPGSTEPGADVDDAKEGALRLFATPFAGTGSVLDGLGVGIAGSTGRVDGTPATPALPGFGTTGRQSFFQYRPGAVADGARHRLAPQARLYAGPVELLAEYTVLRQEVRRGAAEADLTHWAWQLSGAVVVTGEDAREGAVVPRRPFGRETGPGAVEVGARVHELTLDDETVPRFAARSDANEALAWGLTLSWYPNQIVRMMVGYERTTFEPLGAVPDPDTEHLLLARMQFSF
jgi:phosphate-selective porin OprO/OprP